MDLGLEEMLPGFNKDVLQRNYRSPGAYYKTDVFLQRQRSLC